MARRPDPLNRLEKLERLRKNGSITEKEYWASRVEINRDIVGFDPPSSGSGCLVFLGKVIKAILVVILILFVLGIFLSFSENKSNKKEAAPINTEKQNAEKVVEAIDNDEQPDNEELIHNDSTTEEKIETVKENLF